MDMELKERFMELWEKYFDGADPPITFYYTDDEGRAEMVKPPKAPHQCLIGVLSKIRTGTNLCFGEDSIGCAGGKRYLGFAEGIRPNFEYFLSCGIPGELKGERYKKSPEIVRELIKKSPPFKAPGKYIVFKRWDMLETGDQPEIVIFFAQPDVLSGLFTLKGFEESDQNGVYAPFSAGCGSIVHYPFMEIEAESPRAVLGMFDVSARPYVDKEILTFSVTMNTLERMVGNMDESFLITESWAKVKKRIS